ncbi:MAG TPA: HD domain-containing protein [Methanobacterium sp.]|nr:HD domain-containing protein [Methanobacterium sp.]
MKFIRDSVHGNLQLDEFEVRLIDTPQLQRLRRIKQLGFTYLVYPGANHTRFEHSIGTMYLASKLANHLKLDEDQKRMLRTSALLHDAGHGPFSHVSEGVLTSTHEELTTQLIKNSILGDTLKEAFNIKEIIDITGGVGSLGQIISGELDVDRMDYLLRDSYYTGVAYGVIDVERLIYNMILRDNLMLKRKGVQAAESMLLARYFMYPSVYQHHTTRIINAMFRRCLNELFIMGRINPEEIYLLDDLDIISAARAQEGYAQEMIKRLDNRAIYKTVYSLKLEEINNPETVFQIADDKIKLIEEDIAHDMGIDPENVIVDKPEYPTFHEMRTLVAVNGSESKKLGEISSIVSTLNEARFNHADLCIYLPEEHSHKAVDFHFKDYIPLEIN